MSKRKRKTKTMVAELKPVVQLVPVMKGNVLATFMAEVQAMSQELTARREFGNDFLEFCKQKTELEAEFEMFRAVRRGLA